MPPESPVAEPDVAAVHVEANGPSAQDSAAQGAPTGSPRRRLTGAVELGVLAVLAYVPLLLTKPGEVAADTKQYLYLDPGRLMASALSMWDPSTAAGTVTHQQIGYLLPQGPFYWILAQLGSPVWVTQRLWMGSLLFVAGAGVRYCLKALGLSGPGPLVAAVVYELSPYSMQYIERISAILMPWAGLGWMLGFSALAIRKGGWKYPALFALVVALAGGTNATSLIYAGIAPALWVVYELFVVRDAPARRVLASTVKMAGLSLAVSLWWIAGLRMESAYGIDVLKYTETVPAIAGPSLASEVMRGLGYWYFYGSDRLGPWLSSSVEYTQRTLLLVTSFALPVGGFVGAVVARWKVRAYFVFLGIVGLLLSVGSHPYSDPSAVGSALKAFMTETTAGLALRSTDRATPLVVLALSALLGAGIGAMWASLAAKRRSLRFAAFVPAGLAVALAVVNAGPLMTGLAIDPNFERPEHIPSYFISAAKYLDSKGNSTRVWIEPGDDFADYDWGNTIDPVWPGVLTRPSIQRQQLIDGSDATADLLSAFDLTLQQGTYEPSTLGPIARLLSAGDVVLESDYKFWHYNTPAPRPTWALFDPPPAGVGTPVDFGRALPNEAPGQFSLLDEQALATARSAPWPPPVAVFPIANARRIYRAEPSSVPLVLDGSGAGIVDASAVGMLANNPTIFYAGSLDGHPTLLREAIPPAAQLVLTDTNRKVLRRWSSLRDNIGETLPATPGPSSHDPTSQPLQLFATSNNSMETIATYSDAHYVAASSYGNPVALTPEDRPYMAFDGNPQTAWTDSAFSTVGGDWLQVSLDHPVTTDNLDLVQPWFQQPNRWITKVTLTFDGKRNYTVGLDDASHGPNGQIVSFPEQSFSTLRISIDGTTWKAKSLNGASGVGFAEVGIPGLNIQETLQMPSDLLSTLGSASLSHRLTIIMTRDRVSPIPPRSDPELFMSRSFVLPTARTFSIGGDASISALIADNLIDNILGGPKVFGGAVLGSNERLPGDLDARAVFAFDGNPATFWGPGFDAQAQVGAWMQANLVHPVTFDHLNLEVVADKEHSVPTELRITTNDGGNVLVHLPVVRDVDKPGAVTEIPVSFKAVTGSILRFTVEAVRQETTLNWYSEQPIVLPFAIAEIGVPGLHFTPEDPAGQIPSVCRSDLATIDGIPIWLKISGTVGTAENSGDLQISGCGPDAHGIHLGSGAHTIVTAWGKISGLDVNRLVFDSAPGGSSEPLLPSGDVQPVPGTLAGSGTPALAAPQVRLDSSTSTSAQLAVSGATQPFWLVLGQSVNAGWKADIVGGPSLGGSTLIDGYANGWYVTPSSSSFVVDLTWTPQREVDIALVVSAAAILACLLLAFVPWRPRRRSGRRSGVKARHRHRAGGRRRDDVAPREDVGASGVTVTDARRSPFDAAPRAALGAPWLGAGRPTGLVTGLVVAVLAGALAGVAVPPRWALLTAALVAVVTLASCRLGGVRSVLVLAAVGGATAAGWITVAGQMANRYSPSDAWPTHFEAASVLTLVAFLALGADAMVELARGRAAARLSTASQPAAGEVGGGGEIGRAGEPGEVDDGDVSIGGPADGDGAGDGAMPDDAGSELP